MRLLEFHEFVRGPRDAGKYTYISSVDVAAAFDNVPQNCLIETVAKLRVDPYICRYVEVWFKQRIF